LYVQYFRLSKSHLVEIPIALGLRGFLKWTCLYDMQDEFKQFSLRIKNIQLSVHCELPDNFIWSEVPFRSDDGPVWFV
jgi:hypothetical protein